MGIRPEFLIKNFLKKKKILNNLKKNFELKSSSKINKFFENLFKKSKKKSENFLNENISLLVFFRPLFQPFVV